MNVYHNSLPTKPILTEIFLSVFFLCIVFFIFCFHRQKKSTQWSHTSANKIWWNIDNKSKQIETVLRKIQNKVFEKIAEIERYISEVLMLWFFAKNRMGRGQWYILFDDAIFIKLCIFLIFISTLTQKSVVDEEIQTKICSHRKSNNKLKKKNKLRKFLFVKIKCKHTCAQSHNKSKMHIIQMHFHG